VDKDKANAVKKTYEPPKLSVYGDLAKIVRKAKVVAEHGANSTGTKP
jgi:hypothetical protein